MFHRKADDSLAEWRLSGRRTVPVITGPRGVGKTASALALGDSYSACIHLDFGADPGLRPLLSGSRDQDELVRRLRSRFGPGSVVPGDTLVVADEACLCPWGMRQLSGLSGRGTVDIVATASSARGDHPDADPSNTPGLETVPLEPVGFRGFLGAMGADEEDVALAEDCLSGNSDVPRPADRRISELFRRYVVTGGMPGAVNAMARTGRLRDVLDASRRCLAAQMTDARRLLPSSHDIVRDCLRSVPAQLEGNGRFAYSRIPGYSPGRCRESVGWLAGSGVLHLCTRSVSAPGDGVTDPDSFKAYCDGGTLACLMDGWCADAAMNGNYGSCPCAVVENCAASELAARGTPLLYYRSGRREADFLVPHAGGATGVSVRPTANGRRKSLTYLLDEGVVTRTVEFGDSERSSCEERYPLYAIGFPDLVFPTDHSPSTTLKSLRRLS